ncbi:metal ABC transporter solute-binding protein, Zn/Mn family [Uliginosibacterium sp. 31-12]|uniref:metal ABC transporter substrate-binding protein n=1 Tax=Uliginosibacterium sp. 31-12 TaxID=3062781 RepID=UPI0026E3D517|nr:zinc ABC transporter substrate-binding protein [Uliginosibacterium sp. 31-12]MDO6388059.1 zinc ABC transporter substrate-binding protein [Uliginosibacterium sp. 31-12]
MKRLKLLALAAGLLAANLAHASLKVVACEPEWGALVQELAGPRASLYTATTALQDVHHIQARPSLIAAVRTADLLVCTGAELETGWLPVLQRQSGNAAVQVGQPGYFEAASTVRMLEVPTKADRADGDVHAAGNPHIQTDPRNIARVATALSQRLSQLDPAGSPDYARRLADFSTRWQAAIQRWEAAAAPLRGLPIVVQHKAFPYLQDWLGLREVATLEPKPGIEPGSGHLATLIERQQQNPARMVLRAAYNDGRAAEWFASRAKIPVVVLPFTVGGNERAKDLFSLFDETLAQLLKAAR